QRHGRPEGSETVEGPSAGGQVGPQADTDQHEAGRREGRYDTNRNPSPRIHRSPQTPRPNYKLECPTTSRVSSTSGAAAALSGRLLRTRAMRPVRASSRMP